MSTELSPLRPEAIETLARIIGQYFTGVEISRLFERSSFGDLRHDGGTKWRFVEQAFNELQRRAGDRPHCVLQVIKTACHPQGWINQRDAFDAFLGALNKVLTFYGLQLDDKGQLLETSQKATTVSSSRSRDEAVFDARGFHPMVVRHGRGHFVRGAYFHAVFECCKAFDAAVRENTGSTKNGQPLMSEALSLTGPVKLNSQTSQSEKDEQQGIMYLGMGLMNAVRNPQAHEPELNWPMKYEDALDVLALISFLVRKFETAIVYEPGKPGRKVQL